ncbi:hypothetical protein Rhsp01_17220 [Rhizobium sp. NBRC 114257]|uniref:Uncharacterized protein n=1 Tax=Rhizobium dioscoreae TaxID=2653122 RepID=A0ABQ0Z1C7_9HYPH|nr:hypothetical protein RsS93_17180 [Rhizobium dioscoreae]GLU80546.1 hypothetical protein Rhsp01_17220 [Rhizobium sp. NBRC 114257]
MVRKGVQPVEATVENSELRVALQTGRFLVSVGMDTPMGNRGKGGERLPAPHDD